VTPQIARIAPQVPSARHRPSQAEHRMGCNYLWFRRGDANNAVPAAAGYFPPPDPLAQAFIVATSALRRTPDQSSLNSSSRTTKKLRETRFVFSTKGGLRSVIRPSRRKGKGGGLRFG
jgi:hypothetical protein